MPHFSRFSVATQHQFLQAMRDRTRFTSSSYSFHGYPTSLYCQGCERQTDQYVVTTFNTVLYQECLRCRTAYLNTSWSVQSVSSKYHVRLLQQAIETKDAHHNNNVGRGERYLA